jgi:hypothetical protein
MALIGSDRSLRSVSHAVAPHQPVSASS